MAESNEIKYTHDQIRSLKLSLYMSLKNLYDKWICTYTRDSFRLQSPEMERKAVEHKHLNRSLSDKGTQNDVKVKESLVTEFNNFVFVDCFYNNIGDKLLVNPKHIFNIVKDASYGSTTDIDNSTGTYKGLIGTIQFMSKICEMSRTLLLTLPVYNNYYDAETISNIFKPMTFDNIRRGSTYVIMYTPQYSGKPNFNDFYKSDNIDIAGVDGNMNKEVVTSLFGNKDDDVMMVPAFGVTYARQNQSYFKKIKVNMNSPKQTDFSIANTMTLALKNVNGSTIEPHTIAQDAFAVFANHTYNCVVEMLGCMNIMPGMYFQLNNIPMFRGAYMVIKVEHSVECGNMTTRFTGIRIAKNLLPYADTVFAFSEAFNDLVSDYDKLCPPEDKVKEREKIEAEKQKLRSERQQLKSQEYKYKYYSTAKMVETTVGSTPYFNVDTPGNSAKLPYTNGFSGTLERNTNYEISDKYAHLVFNYAKHAVLSFISRGYTAFDVTYDKIHDFFDGDNSKKYGFKKFTIKSTEENMKSFTSNLEIGTVISYEVLHKRNNEIKRHYAVWNGSDWVYECKSDKIFPFDTKTWAGKNDFIDVYMYNDKLFESTEIFKKFYEQ